MWRATSAPWARFVLLLRHSVGDVADCRQIAKEVNPTSPTRKSTSLAKRTIGDFRRAAGPDSSRSLPFATFLVFGFRTFAHSDIIPRRRGAKLELECIHVKRHEFVCARAAGVNATWTTRAPAPTDLRPRAFEEPSSRRGSPFHEGPSSRPSGRGCPRQCRPRAESQ